MKPIFPLLLISVSLLMSCGLERPEEISYSPDPWKPSNNEVIREQLVNFQWNGVDRATEYKLSITVFDSLDLNELILDTVIYTTQHSSFLNPGTYIWQVQASNYVSTTYSEQQTFTVDTTTLKADFTDYRQTVDLFYPVDSVTYGQYEQIELRWYPADSASSYHLLVVSPSFYQPKKSVEYFAYSESFNVSLDTGTYQWIVRPRAVNNLGQTYSGTYSEIRTFLVKK